MAELLRGISHAAYLADDLPSCPHFGRGVARRLLEESARHAWCFHPKLGGQTEPPPTPEKQARLDFGSLVHALLLGSGPEIVLVEVKKKGSSEFVTDFRTDAAQEIRNEAASRRAVAVLPHKWEAVQVAVSILRKQLDELGIMTDDPHAAEQTILWDDGETACKSRLDLWFHGSVIYDFKVTELPPATWRRGMVVAGYDLQAYSYERAAAALHPELAGRVELEFVLLEPTPPYSVAVQPVGATMRATGESRWNRAIKTWRECMASGAWPGYGRQEPAEAPPWALDAEMTAAINTAGGDPAWAR